MVRTELLFRAKINNYWQKHAMIAEKTKWDWGEM